jgi:DNA-directed RNA polymerase specialized sigma24 family protein
MEKNIEESIEILQKSCIDLTEEMLKKYKYIIKFIEGREKEIKDMGLEDNTTTMAAISYDSIQVSPTYNIGRMTERKALDRIEEETELKIELYENKKLKNKIERLVNNLSPIHKEVIQYRYLESLEWIEIADIMNYSKRQLINKKNEAIRSIAVELYGIKVFKEEEPTLFDMVDI